MPGERGAGAGMCSGVCSGTCSGNSLAFAAPAPVRAARLLGEPVPFLTQFRPCSSCSCGFHLGTFFPLNREHPSASKRRRKEEQLILLSS